jgi:hypothetical protein
MKRRSFIAGLSMVATSMVSFDAVGQMRAKRYRIGFITGVPPEGAAA